MNFTKEWKPIEFLEYGNKEPLPLAEVIPFIFKDEIMNARASDMDGDNIMILYDLSLKFHERLCNEVEVIYGIKKKNMVRICIIINKNNNYLKYIKIIKPIVTFLDLNNDILGLITQYLVFKDQLNLRDSCKILKENIVYHNYENSNFLSKLGSLIRDCSSLLNDRFPQKCTVSHICTVHDNKENCSYKCSNERNYFYSTNGIYSDLKVIKLYGTIKFEFLSYTNFKIFGIDYTFKELLDNINIIKSIELLMNLLRFDDMLRRNNKSFILKDKKLMKQHDLSDHYYKTNDCYFKFNKDLKKFFDDSEWFTIVKDIICGNRELCYSLEELDLNISPTLEFGKKVYENYDDIKKKLSRCKRFYHKIGRAHV